MLEIALTVDEIVFSRISTTTNMLILANLVCAVMCVLRNVCVEYVLSITVTLCSPPNDI